MFTGFRQLDPDPKPVPGFRLEFRTIAATAQVFNRQARCHFRFAMARIMVYFVIKCRT